MDNGPEPPRLMRCAVESDGFRVRVDLGGLPMDVVERMMLGALAYIQRELQVARLVQAEALREQAKPRVTLPGAPI